MLENRSFDHMLGWCDIPGLDGASPSHCNTDKDGHQACSSTGAKDVLGRGPLHDFPAVFKQTTGHKFEYHKYCSNYHHRDIDMSGFLANYRPPCKKEDADQVMAGFADGELPALHTLAKEFAVCDAWYSSMPGPTFPNRFFVHAATSGGMDDSPPSQKDDDFWDAFGRYLVWGLRFPQGTIFDRLEAAKPKIDWRIYKDRSFDFENQFWFEPPISRMIYGVTAGRCHDLANLERDLKKSKAKRSYTFIEPFYNFTNEYGDGGTSQHPNGSALDGDGLIARVYNTILRSKQWPNSMLIITYDEHGGFYDHDASIPVAAEPSNHMLVRRPACLWRPHDRCWKKKSFNRYGFDFTRFGVRVPAVVVSPWIQPQVVHGDENAPYCDHTSVIRTVCDLWGLPHLTVRDRKDNARSLLDLASGPLRDCNQVPPPLPTSPPADASAAILGDDEPLDENSLSILVLALREMAQRDDRLAPLLADEEALEAASVADVKALRDWEDEARATVAGMRTAGDLREYWRRTR